VILDNYSIHSTSLVNLSLDTPVGSKIQLHFLPPYSPDHNKIERVWQDLHANVGVQKNIAAILYRLQMIRVDTCGGGKERENLAQFAKRAYDSGRHIAIYPEGNLMAPGERERYRSGIYYLSRDLGLPVTPVATSVGLLWNRRDWRKKAGRAAIQFLPPIETGLDKRTFMRRLEDTIETASDHLIAEFSGRPYAPSQLVLRSQGDTGSGKPASASLA